MQFGGLGIEIYLSRQNILHIGIQSNFLSHRKKCLKKNAIALLRLSIAFHGHAPVSLKHFQSFHVIAALGFRGGINVKFKVTVSLAVT